MEEKMKDLGEIAERVKGMDDNVNNLIVPLLKDTIADGNRHNKRLFILTIILSVSILLIAISSQILVAIQNQRYADFLSQFEFETSTDIMQDLDATDGGNITNPVINNMK